MKECDVRSEFAPGARRCRKLKTYGQRYSKTTWRPFVINFTFVAIFCLCFVVFPAMPYEQVPLNVIGNNYHALDNKNTAKQRTRITSDDEDSSSTTDDVPLMAEERDFGDEQDDYMSEGYQSSGGGRGSRKSRRRRKKMGCLRTCCWFCCGGWITVCSK